jgi:purine nucleoside permease
MKKLLCIVPLVLLFCFTIACQDKADMAELERYKAQAKVEQQNEVLLRTAKSLGIPTEGKTREQIASEIVARAAPK